MHWSDIARRFGRRVTNLMAEAAALVFVLIWITAGVPFASGVFVGEAELAFGAGVVIGLLGWVLVRRFVRVRAMPGSTVAVTLLLVAMGGLVVFEPVVARVATGLPLTVLAIAVGTFLAAGTCAISLAWCDALATHDPGDVEAVSLVSISIASTFALLVSLGPTTATGLVVVCPLLAWALLMATRGDVIREGRRSQSKDAERRVSARHDDRLKKFFHGTGIFLMYFVLGFLGEFGPRGIVSLGSYLPVIESVLTVGLTVVLILWLICLGPSARVPAVLPWAAPLVVLSMALRGCNQPGTLLVGSAIFSATLAFVCFSTVVSLTEEDHERSGRTVVWTAAAPDVAVALMAGAFMLGGVMTHVLADMFATEAVPSVTVTLFALTALTLAPVLAGYRSSAYLRARDHGDLPSDDITRGVCSLVGGADLDSYEIELLDELARGRSLTAVRNRTGDSLYTLEKRLNDICAKLDVGSLAELQSDILVPLVTSRKRRLGRR